MEILKVSAKSNPVKSPERLRIFIERKRIRNSNDGAGSLNQAIKAVAIARGFLAPSGEDIVLIPAFNEVIINGENKTALKLLVQKK